MRYRKGSKNLSLHQHVYMAVTELYCTTLLALLETLLVLVLIFNNWIACKFCSLHSRKHEGDADSSPVAMLIPEATRVTVKVVFCILVRYQANATRLSCPASSVSLCMSNGVESDVKCTAICTADCMQRGFRQAADNIYSQQSCFHS